MGILKGRGTLDPRAFRHQTPVLEGDMVAIIEIFRPTEGETEPVWDPEAERWISPSATLLWRGNARVVPNKDWRARNRDWTLEPTAEHAVRIQMNLYKNHLVPRAQWPAEPVDINHGYIVHVVDNPNDRLLERYMLTVRNAIGASDNWHRTLLCDVNLGGRINV